MKLVTRYILKELSLPFILGLLLFTGILLTHQLFELTELIFARGLGILQVVIFVATGVPSTFFFTVPMAVLLATLMAYGRLAGDLELTILRASGYPLRSLIIPPLIAASVLTAGMLGLREYGLPALARYQERTLLELEIPEPPRLMVPGRYLTIGPYTIFAEKVTGNEMADVFLEDSSDPQAPLTVLAARGQWEKINPVTYALHLEDGTMHQKYHNDEYRNIKFQRQSIALEFSSFALQPDEALDTIAPLSTLHKEIKALRENRKELREKYETEETDRIKARLNRLEKNVREKELEFYQDIALPFAAFFLVLLGAPLGIMTSKVGKSMGFTISLLIILFYYLLITFGEPLAEYGWMPTFIAMWLPNILYGIAGMSLLFFLHKRGH